MFTQKGLDKFLIERVNVFPECQWLTSVDLKMGPVKGPVLGSRWELASLRQWGQMAERVGSRAVNQKVVGSIPGRAK